VTILAWFFVAMTPVVLLGLFAVGLAMCAVASDADELTREHLARRARETQTLPAARGCDGPEVMSRSMRRRYREVGCGR
jgi:hypothetical protein